MRACAIIEKSLTSTHDVHGVLVGNENAELIFNTKDWLYTMCNTVVRLSPYTPPCCYMH